MEKGKEKVKKKEEKKEIPNVAAEHVTVSNWNLRNCCTDSWRPNWGV